MTSFYEISEFAFLFLEQKLNKIKNETARKKSIFQLQSTQLLGPKKDGRKTQSAIAIVAASAFFDT